MSDTKILLLITLVWAAIAYLVVPRLWALYFRRHPLLNAAARLSQTADGHPGDPTNIGIAGSEQELNQAMTAAGWRWDQPYEGRTAWFGAATFDKGVGLSHTTGQVTHHIAPDIDAERDRLLAGLQQAVAVQTVQWIDDFHTELEGRNGGGDPWHTDGRLAVVLLQRLDNGAS